MRQAFDLTPAAECRLDATSGDPAALAALLLDPRLSERRPVTLSAEMTETVRLALTEILHSVLDHAGPGAADASAKITLWLDSTLLICSIRFAGAPLPGWLLANWDRSREPRHLSAPSGSGWGWLLVRDAIDCVSYERLHDCQLLFLEKRF